MSTIIGTPTSLAIPVPTRSHAWRGVYSRAETPSPCSSYSDVPSTYSDVNASTWSPAGVYVPLHRRSGSDSSTASTAPTSAASSPRLSKRPLLLSHQPDAKLQSRVYSREELLALAPSSLIYTSLRPVITPQLLAAHSRILRARGEGIARALDMARTPANIHNIHTHPVTSQLQSTPSPQTQLQLQPQATRRRDRRRPTPRRAAQNSNLSKSAPRRQLDMTRSWRAPQTVAF